MSGVLCGVRNRVFLAAMTLGAMLGWIGPLARTSLGQPAEKTAPTKSSPEALRIYEGAANVQNQKAFDLAVEGWAQFLAKFPDDPLAPKARYYEGICHLQLKNWDKAIDSFETIVRDYPKFDLLEDASLNLGWCQYSAAEAGDKKLYEPAISTFTKLLKEFPNGKHRGEALFFRGESLYALDKKQEAIASYKELVAKQPQAPLRCDALYALGVALEELEQFKDAGATYDVLLSDCDKSDLASEVRMRKAETLLQTGQSEQAEQMFASVATEPGFKAADHALLRRAFCLQRLDRFREAAESYVQLTNDYPRSNYLVDAQIGAGRAYYRAKQYDAAATWLTKALEATELLPADWAARGAATDAAHWLSQVRLAQNQPVEAERIANTYINHSKEHPAHVDLLLDRADALYEQPEKRAQAIPVYLQLVQEFGSHRLAPQALYNAAFGALELKRYDESLNLVTQFLQKFKDDALVPDARFVAVEAAIQKRDFANAKRDLQSLIKDYPERSDRNAWRVRYGMALYLNAEYEAAIEYLSPLVSELSGPEQQAEANYLIGASHFFENRFDEAAQHCEAAFQIGADWRQADEAMLILARCQQKQNQLDAAKSQIHELIAKFPHSGVLDQAYYRLGEAHYAAAEYQPALAAYQHVLETNANSTFAPFALYGSGWCQLKLGEHESAIQSFASLLQKFPQHELADDTLLASGMARRQGGQLEAALTDLNKYLATKPVEPQKSEALYERALVEVALQKYPDAIKTLGGLAETNPPYINIDKVLYELAWAYHSADDKEKALAEFARLAADYPQSPLAAEASFHVGESLYDQQKFAEAVKAYEVAHKFAAGELKEKAAYKLGWAAYQLKNYDQAIRIFKEQEKSFPQGALRADAVFMTAESLFKQEKYEDALTAFTSALNVKPSSEKMETLTLLHGGQSAAQLKEWQRALKLLESIPEKYPNSPYLAEAHYECGWVQQNLNHFDEALSSYDKAAAQRDAVGARARFMMGEVRFAQKKYDESIREYQRVMYLYGADDAVPEIKNWQAKAAYAAGRCAEVQVEKASNTEARTSAIANAKKFYSFVAEKHPDNELAAEAQKRLEALAKL